MTCDKGKGGRKSWNWDTLFVVVIDSLFCWSALFWEQIQYQKLFQFIFPRLSFSRGSKMSTQSRNFFKKKAREENNQLYVILFISLGKVFNNSNLLLFLDLRNKLVNWNLLKNWFSLLYYYFLLIDFGCACIANSAYGKLHLHDILY